MLTAEQRETRKTGIGGSDVASIVGMSPWKAANEVYLEKRGEIEEENIDEKEIIIFGNLLEDVVASEYARRNSVKVERRNQVIRHSKYDFMLANIDRKVVGIRKGLECKTADKFTRGNWGADGSDEVPDYYHIQCGHYMNVLNYSEWDLAVLIGGNEYRQYHLQRDKELSEMLLEACIKFWEMVKKGEPPEIDFEHQSAIGAIKRMYPGTNGQTIELPKELEHWHHVKVEAAKEVSKYEKVVDTCKARIMEAIGENAVGQFTNIHQQYKRTEIKKKEFTVAATSYYTMRASAIRETKS